MLFWTTAYVLILLCGITSTQSKLVHGKRLNSSNTTTIIIPSVEECFTGCFLRSNCESFNFNRLLSLCELNADTLGFGKVLEYSRGWVFGDVRSLPPPSLGNCNNISCPEGQFCEDSTKGYNCRPEECDPNSWMVVENSIKLGNMNEAGSQIVFECVSPYVLFGPNVSVCSENRSWSELPTCETVCEDPGILANIFIKILHLDILSKDGLSRYQGREYSSTTSLGHIRDTSNVSFMCSTTEYGTVPAHITCDTGVWKFTPACPSGGISCHLLTTCTLTSSVDCIEDVCRCPLGKSYGYSSQQCVSSCHVGFADTFTQFDKIGSDADDYTEIPNISLEECVATCIQASSCGSFEYGVWKNVLGCYIRHSVYADYSNLVDVWDTGALYLRDCA